MGLCKAKTNSERSSHTYFEDLDISNFLIPCFLIDGAAGFRVKRTLNLPKNKQVFHEMPISIKVISYPFLFEYLSICSKVKKYFYINRFAS